MKNAIILLVLATPAVALICLAYHANAQGRQGGRAGGGGGGGGGAGPSRPANIGGGVSKTPSLSPGGSSKAPSRPAPSNPIATPKQPSDIQRPAPSNPIAQPKLPSNFQRPAQLPAVSQPKVSPPNAGIGLPKNQPPNAGVGLPKNNLPNVGTLPARPPSTGLLPGGPVQPGVKRPSNDDLGKWLNLPKDPGNRPSTLPARPPGPIAGGGASGKIKDAINQRPNVGKGGNIVDNSIRNYQKQGVYIRNNVSRQYYNQRWFSPTWWQSHNFAYPRWGYYGRYPGRPWAYWWRPATWAACIGWFAGPWGQPFYYDYGTNVVYNNNVVYVNNVAVASAAEYANEAIQLASAPPPPDEEAVDWMPLGTFALASSQDDQSADILLQLTISKDGLISGTCFNNATNKAVAVEGRVDPTTQRAAFRMVDQPDIVLETGIYNLTQDQTPVLVHFGTLNTQTWFLVRLEAPSDG